ncbi:hypothetical protein ACFQ07_31525 [Actinomadura adrarensis]|uniref:Uncharacterized protein n=1 Tax=Actinomadura adrarensis TaxID=1819600 RepID=A0ABW3CQJ0_9ACTN
MLNMLDRTALIEFLSARLPEGDDPQRMIFEQARALVEGETGHEGADLMMLQAGESIMQQLARPFASDPAYLVTWRP